MMASSIPEFVTEAPTISKHHFKIHIAIDFGTDGTALAYATGGDEKKVFVHKDWASTKYEVDVKPKTIILLDENGEVLGFGKDAKHMYITATNMSKKWMLFEKFKMSLYDNDGNRAKCTDNDDEKKESKIDVKQELIAANGNKVKSSIVFIAAFKYLQQTAKDYLKRKRIIKNIKNSDIQWIVTVPAIWNDNAKYQMRQWTIDAGLVDENIEDQCKIVYEPDCASLAIQHHIHKSKSKTSNFCDEPLDDDDDTKTDNEGDLFGKGDKYILIDAGGGTVDIACHEILGEDGEFGVKEVLHPSGGPWGSCYIDDQFKTLLEDIFGVEWIEEFKRTKPSFYTKLLDNFQNAKKTFYTNSEQDQHNICLPFEFVGFIQDKLEEKEGDDNDNNVDIEEAVTLSKVFGKNNMVSLSEEYLTVHHDVWKIMFDNVLDPTIKHIEKLLREPKLMRKCKYLCLVGGLSTSPYFQSQMEGKFGPKSKYKLSVIIPQRPVLSVVEGAAYFGVTDNYIKARMLRYTYGQIVSRTESRAKYTNVPSNYILKKENRYYNEHKNAWMVKNCFAVIARKNEEIYTGQVKRVYCSRWDPTQTCLTIEIIYSSLGDPKILTDGKLLGNIEVNFDNQDETDMKMITEFHFYDTVIKAVVYREKTPHDKQIRYITNFN